MSTTPASSSTSSLTSGLTTGAGGTSTFNISGLASGLDDNQIITELMSIASLPEVNITNQITLETTRQSDLTAIQTQLGKLSVAVSELVDPATWSTSQQVTSSDPTNVSATGGGLPPGGFEIGVSQLARAAQLTQTSSLAAAAGDDQLTLQIGAAASFAVNVHAGDSLQTIASAINAAAGSQLYASVVNSKLTLSSEVTGAANTISVGSTGGGTLAADLGLTQTVSPRDAQYTVDGGSTQTSASNTLTNIATGLTVTLQGVTSSPASVTVAQAGANVTGVQTALEDFVTAYNQTVTAIESKLNETKVANPSNDAERAQGDLANDSGLRSLLARLRESLGSAFSGNPAATSTLSQVGLSTGAAVGTGALNQDSIDGLLTLNTNTLATQLAANFQNVKNLFTKTTGSYSSEGLAQRLNGVLSGFTGSQGVIRSEINGQGSLIASLTKQKQEWQIRLAAQQVALQQKYANMETLLGQLQAQGTTITNALTQLNANNNG